MKLTIKNLGPLTKGGSIDLDKRFYVFVGKNNSGKTYVANVLTRLFNTQYRYDGLKRFGITPLNISNKTQSLDLNKKTIDSFSDLISNWITKQLSSIFNTNPENFEHSEIKLTEAHNALINKELQFEYHYNLSNNFSEENPIPNQFLLIHISKPANSLTINITKKLLSNEESVEWRKNIRIKKLNVRFSSSVYYSEDDIYKDLGVQLVLDITTRLLPFILSLGDTNPILLPSERTFYSSFWKYILRIEKDNYDKTLAYRLEGKEIPYNLISKPYNASTNNLIKAIEGLDISASTNSKYLDLVSDLEDIMGGEVVLVKGSEEGIGRMEIKFQTKDTKKSLDMYMASSSVNQLTILYIYFKYWAQDSHNFLLIDEPEENLHPENQVKLINLLIKFADRNNNKVLITTHSSLVTETVNNYIRIGYLKNNGIDTSELLKGHIHDNLNDLNETDFGVYYFGEHSLKEYSPDEFGVFFKDFVKVEDEVRDISNILKDKIYKVTHPKMNKL